MKPVPGRARSGQIFLGQIRQPPRRVDKPCGNLRSVLQKTAEPFRLFRHLFWRQHKFLVDLFQEINVGHDLGIFQTMARDCPEVRKAVGKRLTFARVLEFDFAF